MLWFRTAKDRHIEFLQAQVCQLQNYILMTGGGAPIGFPKWESPAPAAQPDGGPSLDFSEKAVMAEVQRMYTTEEEEDIEFALQEGLIDKDEADRRMREVMETANDIDLM